MGKKRALVMGIAMAAVVLGAGSPAMAADPEAQKAIQARQDLMKSIGGNVKALRELLEEKGSETPADASRRAEEISEAAQKIALLFKPEYHISNVPDIETTARPEVWTDYEDFTAKAEALQEASSKLALAAQTEDMSGIKTAFAEMSKTCGGCHQTYRVKKN